MHGGIISNYKNNITPYEEIFFQKLSFNLVYNTKTNYRQENTWK